MANDPFVRAIPLGGLGQVGGNLMVYETERDMIVVDCGTNSKESIDYLKSLGIFVLIIDHHQLTTELDVAR